MCSCGSLRLLGGARQAVGYVSQVGLADSRRTLCMGLPSCLEQRARDWTPQLGAGVYDEFFMTIYDVLCQRNKDTEL